MKYCLIQYINHKTQYERVFYSNEFMVILAKIRELEAKGIIADNLAVITPAKEA